MDIKRSIVSCIVTLFILAISFTTLNDFGIAWDEPIHIRNADLYVSWLSKPAYSNKDTFFKVDVEDVHPHLRKTIAGLTHKLFTNTLKILDNTRGYRISVLLYLAPFVFIYTYVAIGYLGISAGILTAFMYSFLPHVLYLTPLVTMDYAIAALWFLAITAAMKKRFVMAGIITGMTMLTKLHGFLLIVPILLLRPKFKFFALFIITSLVVYVLGWPWLWSDTISHISNYFFIQNSHGSVPVLLFGKIYEFAPWWYTPVMFLTTTPVFVLIFFVIGAYWVIKNGKSMDRVFLLNAVYPILFFSLPGVYRYDWVRLFLPAFPFICLVTARGIKISTQFISLKIIVLLWIITLYTSVIRIHPWESSYYNELIGGINGARRVGMETEFWGNAYQGILPWMNDHYIDPQCVTPTTHPFYYYQAMGQLDSRVNFRAAKEVCQYVIVLMRQGLFIRDPFIENLVATEKPIQTVSIDGVPLVAVYAL